MGKRDWHFWNLFFDGVRHNMLKSGENWYCFLIIVGFHNVVGEWDGGSYGRGLTEGGSRTVTHGRWLTDGAQEVSVCGKSQGRQEFLTGSGPENGGTAWNRTRIWWFGCSAMLRICFGEQILSPIFRPAPCKKLLPPLPIFPHTDTSCTPGCGNGMLLFLDRMCRFYSSAGRGNAIS